MREMEMRNRYDLNADRAFRDEIIPIGDIHIMLDTNRPAVSAEHERLMNVLFGSRAFRG